MAKPHGAVGGIAEHAPHAPGVVTAAAAAKREPPVRAVSAKMQATVLAMPVAIAMAAIWMSAPPVAPPIVKLPVKRAD